MVGTVRTEALPFSGRRRSPCEEGSKSGTVDHRHARWRAGRRASGGQLEHGKTEISWLPAAVRFWIPRDGFLAAGRRGRSEKNPVAR